jgi:hypothetical protein
MPDVRSLEEAYAASQLGPASQHIVPATATGEATQGHGLPGTVNATSTVTSNVIKAYGFTLIGAGCTLSQAGAIKIQLYLDDAGTIPMGAAVSQTLAAGVANAVQTTAGGPAPFRSFTVAIQNTSGSSATITNPVILCQSR